MNVEDLRAALRCFKTRVGMGPDQQNPRWWPGLPQEGLQQLATVLEEVEALVREMDDAEGIALVQIGRLHLRLARYRDQTDAQLRRRARTISRRLPEPDGLLIRRAHRLLDRVGQRSGIRLS